jgi:hypothetical protein
LLTYTMFLTRPLSYMGRLELGFVGQRGEGRLGWCQGQDSGIKFNE